MKKFRITAIILCLALVFTTLPAGLTNAATTDNYDYGNTNAVYKDEGENTFYVVGNADDAQNFFDTWNEDINNNAPINYDDYRTTDDLNDTVNDPADDDRYGNNDRPATDIQYVRGDEPGPDIFITNDIPDNYVSCDEEDIPGTIRPVPIIIRDDVPAYQTSYTIVPSVDEPTHLVYDIGVEVGRNAHISPQQPTNDVKKSSDTNIINRPDTPNGNSFNPNDYVAKAFNPGDAVITFKNTAKDFTEDWNVHVYCRPLDFEKTQYVVDSPKDKDGYLTLYLNYFEFKFEPAYDFKYSTSNTDISMMAVNDPYTPYCKLLIKQGTSGATIVTVKDKYGNSASAVVIVKDDTAASAPEKKGLTNKQFKKLVPELKISSKNGYLYLKWSTTAGTDEFDGYKVYRVTGEGKYKLVKTIKSGETLKYKYKSGKNGTKYTFVVRGYKKSDGKNIYTKYSAPVTKKFKKQ